MGPGWQVDIANALTIYQFAALLPAMTIAQQRSVLERVARGEISPEDAERELAALDPSQQPGDPAGPGHPEPPSDPAVPAAPVGAEPRRPGAGSSRSPPIANACRSGSTDSGGARHSPGTHRAVDRRVAEPRLVEPYGARQPECGRDDRGRR